MKVLYTGEWTEDVYDKECLFLAGPTPRHKDVLSWRPAAISYLEGIAFDGIVLSPEWRNEKDNVDFLNQVKWEKDGLMRCGYWKNGCILFWVPREMKIYGTKELSGTEVELTMPALTTNIEFGRYVGCNRVVYGRPDCATHCGYLDWMYNDITGKMACNKLESTLYQSVVIAYK